MWSISLSRDDFRGSQSFRRNLGDCQRQTPQKPTSGLARATRTRLTFGDSGVTSNLGGATWAPDSRTVFYSSVDKGVFRIFAKAADGSSSERLILESPDASAFPDSVSPDGRYLVYVRRLKNETVGHIWAFPFSDGRSRERKPGDIKPGDGKPFPIVQDAFDERVPTNSPDGKWLAYQSNESGRPEIYITAFPTGGAKWQVASTGGTTPKWRRDGKELFFVDPQDNIVAVDVNASGNAVKLGAAHALFQAVGIQREYGAYDVSADGKKFLINSGNLKEGAEPLTLVQNWPADEEVILPVMACLGDQSIPFVYRVRPDNGESGSRASESHAGHKSASGRLGTINGLVAINRTICRPTTSWQGTLLAGLSGPHREAHSQHTSKSTKQAFISRFRNGRLFGRKSENSSG